MSLTKQRLVAWISGETGLTQSKVLDVVQKTFDRIIDTLAKGSKVEIRNFGVFEVKIRKPKKGRNFYRPEITVAIPSRARVKFKAGKEMKAAVLKLTPAPKRKTP
jgi:nucleoid DNA-binding protein